MERKRPPAIRTLVGACLALLLCGAAAAWLRLETGQPIESGDRRVAPERPASRGRAHLRDVLNLAGRGWGAIDAAQGKPGDSLGVG